jgi:hypothetical protein
MRTRAGNAVQADFRMYAVRLHADLTVTDTYSGAPRAAPPIVTKFNHTLDQTASTVVLGQYALIVIECLLKAVGSSFC